MNDNWVKIHSSISEHHIELVKGLLEENDIDAIVLKQQDSMILSIGQIELYVQKDDVIPAKHLIESSVN